MGNCYYCCERPDADEVNHMCAGQPPSVNSGGERCKAAQGLLDDVGEPSVCLSNMYGVDPKSASGTGFPDKEVISFENTVNSNDHAANQTTEHTKKYKSKKNEGMNNGGISASDGQNPKKGTKIKSPSAQKE